MKPLSERTDEQIRERARELHEQSWVVEIEDDAPVVRDPNDGDEIVRVQAWILLGKDG